MQNYVRSTLNSTQDQYALKRHYTLLKASRVDLVAEFVSSIKQANKIKCLNIQEKFHFKNLVNRWQKR